MRHTSNPKAALHSSSFGAPDSTPFSMKSKSETMLNEHKAITNSDQSIPIGPELKMYGIWKPAKIPMNETMYRMNTPRVAPATAIRIFSFQAINPDLDRPSMRANMQNVTATA